MWKEVFSFKSVSFLYLCCWHLICIKLIYLVLCVPPLLKNWNIIFKRQNCNYVTQKINRAAGAAETFPFIKQSTVSQIEMQLLSSLCHISGFSQTGKDHNWILVLNYSVSVLSISGSTSIIWESDSIDTSAEVLMLCLIRSNLSASPDFSMKWSSI